MDDRENSVGDFDGSYNKLVCQEEISSDDQAFYSNEDKQQVSMSTTRPESRVNHYKWLAVGLAVLAAILLAVDIGLGVYYNQLTGGNTLMRDISGELAKLQSSYNSAVQSREEARKQLVKETTEQQTTKWELEHQIRRSNSYQKQIDKFQLEVTTLKSHIPMIKEGCRHCKPGWAFMNSMCYYLAFSESLLRRSWQDARQFCKKSGADLVVVDSREKQMSLFQLIKSYHDPSRFGIYANGFWIGLRDAEEEGVWKWLDGTRLSEGYWNDGEPNNQQNEDCAAIYPKPNPFKSWNDAPCNHNLKWICEMSARFGV